MMQTTQQTDNLFTRLFLNSDHDGARNTLRFGDDVVTRNDLQELVEATAFELRSHGVTKGDRVALVLGNTPEYVVAFFAVTALGGIVVSIDERIGAERLRAIAKDTRPLFCMQTCELDATRELEFPRIEFTVDLASRTTYCGRKLCGDHIDLKSDVGNVVMDDPALILFSAGSTGHPKGVVLRHGGLFKTAQTVSGVIGMQSDHNDLILSPMTHSGGWQRVTGTILSGGCVVLPQPGMFSVPGLLEDVERNNINGFFTTPPFIRMMLNTAAEKFVGRVPSLRSIEIASAPLTAAELEQLLNLFPHINVFFQYGSTECSRALILDSRGRSDKLHTVGVPTPGVQVRICDTDGNDVADGDDGEVLLGAEQMSTGYFERPDLNAERFRDGWLITGDYGRIDDEGFLTLLGRKDDMINCGGHSYFPAEVEIELGSIEGVASFLVAGVPDPAKVLTDVPWVFVVPEDPEHWSVPEFLASVRRRLPPHMVPRNVVVVESLPLTPSGKPSRRRTLELYGPDASK